MSARVRGIGLALGASAMLAVAPPAFAHDVVVGGNVEEGQTLDAFPEEITLEFSAIPREDFNTFAVTDTSTEEVLFTQEPEVDGRDLTIETPADVNPGPGDYQVGFQITSSDGHATRGGVTFSVVGAEDSDAASAEGDEAENTEATTDEIPAGLKWILAIGAVFALLAVVAMLFFKSRNYGSKGLEDNE